MRWTALFLLTVAAIVAASLPVSARPSLKPRVHVLTSAGDRGEFERGLRLTMAAAQTAVLPEEFPDLPELAFDEAEMIDLTTAEGEALVQLAYEDQGSLGTQYFVASTTDQGIVLRVDQLLDAVEVSLSLVNGPSGRGVDAHDFVHSSSKIGPGGELLVEYTANQGANSGIAQYESRRMNCDVACPLVGLGVGVVGIFACASPALAVPPAAPLAAIVCGLIFLAGGTSVAFICAAECVPEAQVTVFVDPVVCQGPEICTVSGVVNSLDSPVQSAQTLFTWYRILPRGARIFTVHYPDLTPLNPLGTGARAYVFDDIVNDNLGVGGLRCTYRVEAFVSVGTRSGFYDTGVGYGSKHFDPYCPGAV